MAFFGKQFVKLTGKWIPVTKTVSCYDAQRLAKDIEKECTVSYTDVISVLTAIPGVMRRYLAEGHSVKLDGIGSFFLTFECKKTGVDRAEEVSMDQVTNIKVQFRPAMRGSGVKGKFANTLIADDIEWTYLPPAKASATDGNTPMEPEGNAGSGSNAEGSDLEG
jgi:predicted histone-like DNA-binding protein